MFFTAERRQGKPRKAAQLACGERESPWPPVLGMAWYSTGIWNMDVPCWEAWTRLLLKIQNFCSLYFTMRTASLWDCICGHTFISDSLGTVMKISLPGLVFFLIYNWFLKVWRNFCLKIYKYFSISQTIAYFSYIFLIILLLSSSFFFMKHGIFFTSWHYQQ